MAGAPELRARLEEARPLLMDGATGTELERCGVRCELPLWSAHALLECPERVAEIRDQIATGQYETAEKLEQAVERMLDEIA